MKKGILFGLVILLLTAGGSSFADLENKLEYLALRELGPGGYRLGLVLSEINPHLRDALHIESGVVVDRVMPKSAAEKAGIREGDILLRIDGKEIEDVGDVRSFIQSRKEQSPVNIDLLRDGKQISVQVTPTSEERSFFGGPDRPYIGVELQELNRDLASYFNVAPGSGALIVHVEPDSPAEKAGILSGDVITHFNGKQVESPEDVIDQIQDLEDGQSAEISLLRHGKQMHLTVTPEMREGRGFFPQHWNMPDALGIPEQEQLRKDIEREMTDVKKELEVIRKYKFDDLKKEMDQLRKELDSLKNDQTH